MVDMTSASRANISTVQNQQGVVSGVTTDLDISCELAVDMSLCTSTDSNYLCFYIRPRNDTASFRDDVTANNVHCQDMSANKDCYPGIFHNIHNACV